MYRSARRNKQTKSNTYPLGFESCERESARAREGRVSPKVETDEGDDIFRFHERRLRNYEERLDDINPRLDSLSFGGKGEFQPGTIRGLLGGS